MTNDATFELMAKAQGTSDADLSFLVPPTYNIDDMDPRFCMVSLVFTGCYCLLSSKTLDPAYPGMVYIDGKETEPPLNAGLMPMFGQMLGIKVRKYLKDYGRKYDIKITGLRDSDGFPLKLFDFQITTLTRMQPGEVYPEHDQAVLDAARESAVLLKNENHVLPLGKNAAVNVFGAGAIVFHVGCLGAGKINPRYSIRVKEGIEKYSSLRLNEELYEFYTDEKNILPSGDVLERAQELSDTAVVFIGRTSSEAHDNLPEKGQYYLTDEERTLICGLRKEFRKVVAVLNTAYPVETVWMENVDAVLWIGLPGMMGGRALAELLEGTVNPSGRLTTTWAKDYKDYPSSKNFLTLPMLEENYPDSNFVTTVYEEGLYIGYRYFDTFEKEPAFRFGYGLSYTGFSMKGKTEGRKVEVTVKNTGEVPGKEVVQIYAQLPEGVLEQPRYRLVAFAKTKELSAGEQQTITLEISDSALRSFDTGKRAWVIEAGEIRLFLNDDVIGTIFVPETIILQRIDSNLAPKESVRELSKLDPAGTWPTGKDTRGYQSDELPHSLRRTFNYGNVYEFEKPERLITFPEVKENPSLLEVFVAQMSDYELARLSVGGDTGWGAKDAGYAGHLFIGGELEKYELPQFEFSDGNNGLNLTEPSVGFPVSSNMCATWNEELLYREGLAIGKEGRDRGVSCMLAPALNLHRNILCGRNSEYFAEDPLLAGRMAGQQCCGFEKAQVAGCIKHFFANNAETKRNYNHSIMSERVARELYLGAFEYAMEIHMPATVMTGYNASNGMCCSDDPILLRKILREEMGFEGFVMTDWGGYGDQGLEGLICGGVNWIAPGSDDDSVVTPVMDAISSGKLPRGLVQRSLTEMLRVVLEYC
ncbi:glycoside hydrolase family 3 protein [Murimonas intestini]|uniref:glycoside hydrolase family 3 protein n=1 Tax=Murimonas intestini TaxID=1337051 RepID=UPI001651DEAB|nr:glycoside hydrolase family 3 protein [Murimonas intestini]